MTTPPTSPPPRPVSGMIRPPRSNSRLSNPSKPGSKGSDEDSKTSVKVAVRIRPPLQSGDPGYELVPQRFQRSMVHVTSPTNLAVDVPKGREVFIFDRVFGEDVSQDGIWEYLQESTNAFLQGYNVSVMAYGQSGAGKSFTMGTSGPEEQSDRELMGIVPRAAAVLFEHLEKASAATPTPAGRPTSGIRQPNRFSMSGLPTAALNRPSPPADRTWQLKASYVEIYNEQLRDLLIPEHVPASERPSVTIREDTTGRILLSGLQQLPINSIEDLLRALNFGSTIRQTDATTINAKSSRSHAVFSLNLVQKKAKDTNSRLKRMSMPAESMPVEESITVDSKLHFVDLAGSERLKNTGASGERAKEGISINAGLASLGKVISQLSAKHPGAHISYRDSKLTRLLQDSLGGNAITYLVACVNPAEFHLSETLNTIQYAKRARNIQSKPQIQQISDDSDKQALIERLRAEIKFLRDQLRSVERSDQPGRSPSDRPSGKEIELQNQLLDAQENYQALTQRHAKLMSELAKAPKGSDEELPLPKETQGETALERLKRSTSLSDMVEGVVKEYETTVHSLEEALTGTRTNLNNSETKLLECESSLTFLQATKEQLEARLQKLMDRESSTEKYVHELERNLESKTGGEEQDAATVAHLRKELARLREKDNSAEDYITSMEEKLTEANQNCDMMRSEMTRLERLVERQRTVSKLDRILLKLDRNLEEVDEKAGIRDDLVTPIKHQRGLSQALLSVAMGTPIPESELEDHDLSQEAPALNTETDGDGSARATEQSKFVEEKLETVNQELFDLRMEHENTINDFAALSAKYEDAMRALEATKDSKATDTNTMAAATLKSEAGMNAVSASGQISPSRSQSSEYSLVGEQPGLSEHSEQSVQGADPQKVEELQELAAQKAAALDQLQTEYEDLNEKYLDKEDQVEELKAAVTKAKMSHPPSPTSNFLRRKSSQNVMSIDRAHRSLASLGNIAGESFAEDPDIKDQFELHLNAVMHELHQRSERVSVLEGEIAGVKKEMESKMAIISGLTRERTSMKTQSPVDISMFSTMRDQVLQSEAQLQMMHEKSTAREKELSDEVEALKRSIEIIDAEHKSASANAANAAHEKEEFEGRVDRLQRELSEWQAKHSASAAAVEKAEKEFRETVAELEQTLSQVETARQQMSAERDSQASTLAASAAAFEADRQRHTESVTVLQREIEEKKSAMDAHVAKVAELEKENASAQRASSQFKQDTQASLESHRAQIEELVKQLSQHQSAVEAHKRDLKSVRDSHMTELDEVRNSTSRQHREETESRIGELTSQYNDQMTKLRGEIEDLEDTLQQQRSQLEEKGARLSLLEKQTHSRNASQSSETAEELQAKIKTVESHKSEAEKALIEARAKLEELNSAKEEVTKELSHVKEREQRASRLVEELEGQLASQFEEGQQATTRLSVMQSGRDKELAEARAAAQKAQEEIGILSKRLSQFDSHRGSMQSTTNEFATNGDRSSTMSNTVRKSNSVQSLPSPPPAIPLPPLPAEAITNGTEAKELTTPQRVDDQEARIRTIEKHLFAEKQLTATLEEALTDIEKDGKKVKAELEAWKKKCWEYEDELGVLRKERVSNRDSMQAIETEKAGRLRAEKAREALEERMAVLNNTRKKKKSTLNCF